MTVDRVELYKGGSVYVKTRLQCANGSGEYKLRKAEVLDIFRAAARVKILDTGETTTLRYNELEPDEEYLDWRESKEADRKRAVDAVKEEIIPREVAFEPPTLKAALSDHMRLAPSPPAGPDPAEETTAATTTAVRKPKRSSTPLPPAPDPEPVPAPEEKAETVQELPQDTLSRTTGFQQIIEDSRRLLGPIQARVAQLDEEIAELSVRLETATSERKQLDEQRSALELLLSTQRGT